MAAKKLIIYQHPKKIKEKIFEFLESPELDRWKIVFTSKSISPPASSEEYVLGESELFGKIMKIDPNQNTVTEAVRTLIHEFIHILLPLSAYHKLGNGAVEAKIITLEVAVFNIFSPSETQKLLAKVFSVAVWDD